MRGCYLQGGKLRVEKGMLPNHYMDVSLGYGEGTVAYFARAPLGTAIIFVHGFGGHAIDTWERMHELLPREGAAAGVDVVFYGYRSMKAQALASANLLRQFLADFVDPAGTAQKQVPTGRREQYPALAYNKIIIVAHSLGAAVARRAVLDAFRLGQAWVHETRLVLFAPAHCGAILTALKKEIKGTSKILSLFAALIDLNVPVMADLEPNSSFITSLRDETLRELERHPNPPLTADIIVFGELDNVVAVQNFCKDPPSISWLQHGHMSLCKVTDAFRDPLVQILGRL
jgi:pimeloyl-ACP methyl ester carboxylesterase